jgi:hypothetical protein
MRNRELETGELLSLLEIYLSEFIHRNTLLWSQVHKLFYATLIVSLLPNVPNLIEFDISLPILAIRVLGIFMSLLFLYVSLGYAKRLEATTKTYNLMIEKLPCGYQRIPISNLKMGFLFAPRTSYTVIYLMFTALLTINIVLLIFAS